MKYHRLVCLSPRSLGAAALLFGVWAQCCLWAQTTARLSGTVVDPTEAAIANATVETRNTATGLTLRATTNTSGIYQFPELPIGEYDVTVSAPGFGPQSRKGIRLLTSQSLSLEFTLKVGTVNEAVEITASAPVVQTSQSAVQTSVTTRQMQELPLNGRNPLQLVTLTAGAQLTDAGTITGQQDNRGLTVNGLRATQNNFRVDGANYNNRFFGSAPTFPNPDTLAEFTVQSAGYSALESGAGAVVELSTRSGTNQWHGSLFEFLRNTKLNARNFFDAQKSPFKLNQYGGTVGGPIRRDRTFFFYSYQGTKRRASPSPISLTPLSAAQRLGDFTGSAPIIDPQTNVQFPGNIIPASRIDPISQKLVAAYLPLPNNGNRFVSAGNQNVDDEQHLIRIDHAFGDRNRLMGRYFFDENDFQRPFNAPTGFYAANAFRNQTLTLRDTHSFTPRLTVNVAASFSRFSRTQVPQAPGLKTVQDFGANVPYGTAVSLFPGIRVLVNPTGSYFQLFSGGALQQTPTTFDYRGTVSYSAGSHFLQFGADLERDRAYTLDLSFTPATFNFNGSKTGNPLADFLLGLPNQTVQDSGRTNDLRQYKPQFFVQDDWKVSRRLTLNLGVRYEPWLPPVDLKNNLVGFVPGKQSQVALNAPLGLLYPGDPGIPDTLFHKDWNNFAPRVGFAWDVTGNSKTVLRGAYGMFYVDPAYTIYTRTVSTQPNVLTVTNNNPGSFGDPYRGNSPFPRNRVQPGDYANFKFTLPVSGGVLDPSARQGYTQNWNLTLERQLRENLALSVAYVGNLGVKMLAAIQLNPAVYAPGATTATTDARRLFAGLGAVEIASPYQSSNYHSLQINVTQRLSRGLTLLGNYVWSKAIDNSSSTVEGESPANPFNLRANRGPADFDTTHRATISFVYDVPRVQTSHTLVRTIANDWQVNGIATIQSGFPFSVLSGTDRSLSGVNSDRADIVGDPARPSGASQLFSYFNPAAFAPAALGTFGNTGRNAFRGPGRSTVDLAVFKNFVVRETVRVQFRAEGFNIQNRANFSNPVSTVSAGANFGRITAAADPRVFQFGLKLGF